ncbi:MAG: type I methionyl aminopeptidase [bacterium]
MSIHIKTEDELVKMRAAGNVVGRLLVELRGRVKPGVSTGDLDKFARAFIEAQGAIPTFLGYHGYKACICASVNEEVVHGIPGPRVLVEGDIVGVDVGATLDGFVGDAARTFPVGKISDAAKRLLDVTRESLNLGIAAARHNGHVQDIGAAVQAYSEAKGFSVVRDFVGHGIGRNMHEDPQVPNYGRHGLGPKLKAGMTLAIEPMLNAGDLAVDVLQDGWTVVTRDRSLSAHFEDTLIVTPDRAEILTRLD